MRFIARGSGGVADAPSGSARAEPLANHHTIVWGTGAERPRKPTKDGAPRKSPAQRFDEAIDPVYHPTPGSPIRAAHTRSPWTHPRPPRPTTPTTMPTAAGGP